MLTSEHLNAKCTAAEICQLKESVLPGDTDIVEISVTPERAHELRAECH